jgi:hypothetical protein
MCCKFQNSDILGLIIVAERKMKVTWNKYFKNMQ